MANDIANGKPWYKSVTVWGAIIAFAGVGGFTGLNFDPATGNFDGNIYEIWASLVAIGGVITAIYGRFRAKLPIGKKEKGRE